jgi:hypothetical protein
MRYIVGLVILCGVLGCDPSCTCPKGYSPYLADYYGGSQDLPQEEKRLRGVRACNEFCSRLE